MKFITNLNQDEKATLEEAHKNHPSFRFRQRAKSVLLSHKKYTITQLSDLYNTRRETISSWLDRWIYNGITGLADSHRSGRPAHYTIQEQTKFLHYLEHNPHQTKVAIGLIEKETGKKAAIDTYKRILKKVTTHGNAVGTL
jgi:transposase